MKLIFCDMDGSLLNRRSKISPRTLEALIKLEEKGIGVILSSGRHINSLKKYGDMLHFEKYPMSGYSCNNGQAYHNHLGENALEHVKEYSNAVCDDCDHDGIGKYLEDLLL